MSTKNTESDGADLNGAGPAALTNGATLEPTKPITIMLPDDVLKKLKIVAIVKETSVSELVAEAAAGVVRRDLKRALTKVSGE